MSGWNTTSAAINWSGRSLRLCGWDAGRLFLMRSVGCRGELGEEPVTGFLPQTPSSRRIAALLLPGLRGLKWVYSTGAGTNGVLGSLAMGERGEKVRLPGLCGYAFRESPLSARKFYTSSRMTNGKHCAIIELYIEKKGGFSRDRHAVAAQPVYGTREGFASG